jgi:hypothetical protein
MLADEWIAETECLIDIGMEPSDAKRFKEERQSVI